MTAKRPDILDKMKEDYADDPGRVICTHENRTHGLGGGIFVCFACWAKILLGGRP